MRQEQKTYVIKLIEYINKWETLDGIKPKNENEFIQPFLEFVKDIDENHYGFSFDGEGSYFGKQITISNDNGGYSCDFSFEIAYDKKQISVYTGNHHGFWTPEYIRIDDKDVIFKELLTELFNLIKRCTGMQLFKDELY